MRRVVLIHLLLSGMGMLIGATQFLVLFVGYGNHDVGFWSILLVAVAAVCFHLNWVVAKQSLERWHSRVTLRNLNGVGFVSAVAGFTALIWYLFLTFYYKIPVQPVSDSTMISAVGAMVCGKWGAFLMYYSHKYELFVQEGTAPILIESGA